MLLNKKKAEFRRTTDHGQSMPNERQQTVHSTHDADDDHDDKGDSTDGTEMLLEKMKLNDTADKCVLKRRLSSENLNVLKRPKTQKKNSKRNYAIEFDTVQWIAT